MAQKQQGSEELEEEEFQVPKLDRFLHSSSVPASSSVEMFRASIQQVAQNLIYQVLAKMMVIGYFFGKT